MENAFNAPVNPYPDKREGEGKWRVKNKEWRMKVALPIHGAAFSRQQRECVFTKFMVKGRGKALDIHSLFFTRIRTCVFPLLEAKILLLYPQEVADDAIGEDRKSVV